MRSLGALRLPSRVDLSGKPPPRSASSGSGRLRHKSQKDGRGLVREWIFGDGAASAYFCRALLRSPCFTHYAVAFR